MMDFDASPNCWLCQTVVNEAKKYKESKAQIKVSLEHACAKIVQLKKECVKMIKVYKNIIVEMISGDLPTRLICQGVNMCNLKMELDMEQRKRILLTATPVRQVAVNELVVTEDKEDMPFDATTPYIHTEPSPFCGMCQMFLTNVKNGLKDHWSQNEIEDDVRHMCHTLLPNEFIHMDVSMITKLIGSTTPKKICSRLRLCRPPTITESECKWKVVCF